MKRKITGAASFLILLAICIDSHANINIYGGTLTYGFLAGYEIPRGDFAGYVDPGISGGFSISYLPSVTLIGSIFGWRYYFFDASFRYLNTTLSESPNSSISWYSGDVGLVLYYPLFRHASPFAGIAAGGFYSNIQLDSINKTASNSDYLARGKAGIIMPATSSLSFRLEGTYSYYNLTPSPFTSTGAYLSASYNFAGDFGNSIGKGESALQVISADMNEVFAVRYQEYNSRGYGSVTLKNTGNETLYNVRIDVTLEGISDEPKSTGSIKSMGPGDVKMVVLPANLSSRVFSLTEDRKAAVNCRVVYSTSTSRFYFKESLETQFYNKNAITWDRTEHLGSFIMPRDVTVQSFAKRALGGMNLTVVKGIPRKLLTAIVVFESLRAYGISYVSDPQNGYAAAARKKSVDYVQLPAETLRRKAGDCDDLTSLYASMLEGVGISTAIATIPGHVFLVFNTEVPEYGAGDVSPDKNDYIFRKGTVWIPVEVTMTREPFVRAWKEAGRSTRSAGFEFIDTAKAWEHFPPSDNENEFSISHPGASDIALLVKQDLDVIKGMLYDERIGRLRVIAEGVSGNPKHWNNLGIVHGKFHQLGEAEACFNKAINADPAYYPALTNLGNIYMIKKDYKKAAEYYKKSNNINSGDAFVRINLARAFYELREYAKARDEYKKAVANNHGLSIRYGYLAMGSDSGAGGRALDVMERNEMNAWVER
jgi:tetratricopeptide (TPR) repeat protein